MSIVSRPSIAKLLETSPLRHAAFRRFYIGATGSAIGYTMQATIAAWLMATLTPSTLMVALVQTASTGPALAIGLIAGALADVVDRRKIILYAQIILLVAAVTLGASTLTGTIGPATLLVLTFVVGAAFTLYLPAQQASVNDFVSRPELPRALALGAVSFNIARAIGPALAGGLAAWLGAGPAMFAAGLCFMPMFFATLGGKARERVLPGLPETITSGVVAGLRFARHSEPIRALLFRTFTFSLSASAFWSLLPVIARDQLGVGAGGFGAVSAAFGIGAVAGAFSIPTQLQRRTLHQVVTTGAYIWAGAILLVAISHLTILVIIGAFAAGIAWVSVLASVSTGLQSAAPAWVRARTVAMNLVVMQTCIAVGSALWGLAAALTDTQVALAASAALMLMLQLLNRRMPVAMGTEADVTTGVLLPEIAIVVEPDQDDGPILIQLAYRIEPAKRAEFLHAIAEMEPIRLRYGAISWRVFRDLEEEGRFVERFIIGSYGDYIRLRARMTQADREVQDNVDRLQRAGEPIRISRLIGIEPK